MLGFCGTKRKLNDFEEDKIWKENGATKRQEDGEKQPPGILEEGAENSLEAGISNSLGGDGGQSNLLGQLETNTE